MKRIVTFMFILSCLMTAQAQEFNLFPEADVDADGWLWFDTQEKIDKYVGVIDEDNYTVDPNGKIIQMAYANILPDYPETIADPEAYGVDKTGDYVDDGGNPDEAIKGSIILAGASSSMGSLNGGCLVLNLPSCSNISLYLSSEASVYARTLKLTAGHSIDEDDSTGEDAAWVGSTKAIFSKATVFSPLANAGHYKWVTAATDNNGYNEGVTFVSDAPVYFCLQNCRNRTIYVHGIKVTTPKQEVAGVTSIAATSAPTEVYSLDGRRLSKAARGLNIIRQNGQTRKVLQ